MGEGGGESTPPLVVATAINATVVVVGIAGMCAFFWFIIISYNLVIENDAEKHRAFDDDCYQEYIVEWDQPPPYENGEERYQKCLGENPHYENYGDAMSELFLCCCFGLFIFPMFTGIGKAQ
jgi:hypothetical protein